jgi:hypothetical protein
MRVVSSVRTGVPCLATTAATSGIDRSQVPAHIYTPAGELASDCSVTADWARKCADLEAVVVSLRLHNEALMARVAELESSSSLASVSDDAKTGKLEVPSSSRHGSIIMTYIKPLLSIVTAPSKSKMSLLKAKLTDDIVNYE